MPCSHKSGMHCTSVYAVFTFVLAITTGLAILRASYTRSFDRMCILVGT